MEDKYAAMRVIMERMNARSHEINTLRKELDALRAEQDEDVRLLNLECRAK